MEKQIVVQNLLIKYLEYTGGSKTTVLFLHGWRSEARVWEGVMKQLPQGMRLIAMDLPGFGGSQIPDRPFSVGDYADVVRAFISKLGLDQVIIVGHSFGGRTGIVLAVKYPEVVSQLVLVDSAGLILDQQRKRTMAIIAKLVKPLFKPKFMQSMREKIYTVIGSQDYVATPALQQTFVNVINEDLSKYLPEIKQGTLIIWGQQDVDTPLAYAEKMHREIKQSQLIIIPGAGHFSFLDRPQEFIAAVQTFINSKS